jgi:lauroyl/myristoyl acyltransferase
VKDALVYGGYVAGWSLVRKLPERVALGGFAAGADLVWRARLKGVRRLASNLRRVRPDASEAELGALARAGLRTYFRYWCEAFRLQDLTPEKIRASVVTHNEPAFWKAIEAGHGVVAALPHMGNWDLAGAWAATVGAPVVAVAQRLTPEKLFQRFVGYREALGIEVVPLTGGPDPMPLLVTRLREGRLVCLVADRDLSKRGVEVSFFGEATKMPAGPAALAVRTGACLMPVTLWYEGPAMHVKFHEPLDPSGGGRDRIRTLTQAIADEFAAGIAEHPADWHMLQRLWLADLEPRAES